MARRRQLGQNWIPEQGTVLDERYRLDEMVDRGGMGVIMRGEHLRMKRVVAVKLLSPDIADEEGYRARFQREVDLAATIEHPNIVRCYDFGETKDGVLYLVMELLEGRSLKEVLSEEGRMSTRRVADLMLQALDGMSTAHVQDVVHRDLKPSNMYVVRDHRGQEVVKVLDFGLAKSLSSDHVALTKTGAICGTANYVAPESLVLQQVGTEGDVYAVGLIMLEMLLGRQVCMSRSMTQTFLQHLVVPAQIPRRVWDTDFGQLIARALQKHPEARFQNAEQMYQALSEIIDDVPDITLSPAELPPLPSDNLDDQLLKQLGEGKYATLGALHDMPAPGPWDTVRFDDNGPDTLKPTDDEPDTIGMRLSESEAELATVDENSVPRTTRRTDNYPEAVRWKPPADLVDTIQEEPEEPSEVAAEAAVPPEPVVQHPGLIQGQQAPSQARAPVAILVVLVLVTLVILLLALK